MYVRLKTSKQSKNPTLQIVEGVRVGKKVKQRVIASLGVVNDQENLKKLHQLTEHLLRKLEEQGLSFPQKIDLKNLIHSETIYDGFGQMVHQMMQLTGFSKVIREGQVNHNFDLENIVKLIITQRMDLPCSKLRTWQRQEDHGFYGIELQDVYRAMDTLFPLDEALQKQAFEIACSYSSTPVDCFFFDVTTLYFESVEEDDLKGFGFNKDQKHHQVQIVLALVVSSEGLPIAYEVFKGNTAETKTLIPVLASLRSRFSVKNVTVVCDRGMASAANVEALQKAGFHFVIASKLRALSKDLKINDLSLYQPLPNADHFAEEQVLFRTLPHPQYKDTVLVVTYSSKRAAKDREDRERLVRKLQAKMEGSEEAAVKKVISNHGYKKFTSTKAGSAVVLNQSAIEKDALWDGFHGIAVSNSANLEVKEALMRYKQLWRVEEAFRVAKSTLKTRPIFHWKPERIKTHVLICFLSLFIERFLELLLRQQQTPLTPERIRYALHKVHTTIFTEKETQNLGKMESSLTEDAKMIFKALGLPVERLTTMNKKCCA